MSGLPPLGQDNDDAWVPSGGYFESGIVCTLFCSSWAATDRSVDAERHDEDNQY